MAVILFNISNTFFYWLRSLTLVISLLSFPFSHLLLSFSPHSIAFTFCYFFYGMLILQAFNISKMFIYYSMLMLNYLLLIAEVSVLNPSCTIYLFRLSVYFCLFFHLFFRIPFWLKVCIYIFCNRLKLSWTWRSKSSVSFYSLEHLLCQGCMGLGPLKIVILAFIVILTLDKIGDGPKLSITYKMIIGCLTNRLIYRICSSANCSHKLTLRTFCGGHCGPQLGMAPGRWKYLDGPYLHIKFWTHLIIRANKLMGSPFGLCTIDQWAQSIWMGVKPKESI